MTFAREGHVPVAVAVLVALTGGIAFGWVTLAALFAVVSLVAWAYRDVPAVTPALPLAAVSAVTGTLRSIGPRADPWLQGREATRAVVSVPLPGFAVIRAPIEGKIMDFWVRGGRRGGTSPEEGSPTCYTLWVQTDEGDDIIVAVHGRRVISRFRASVAPGERVGHGHQLGFIYFGRVVSVYLPAGAQYTVPPGAALGGGSTVIATLPRPDLPT